MSNYNIKEEIWKDIKGYEGLYMVSNTGRVWSCRQSREMKQSVSKGYLLISLSKLGNKYKTSVHRLVAGSFVDNPEHKKEVNHIDEDKLNNSVSNLEWCTSKENANHGTRNKRISDWNIENSRFEIRGVLMMDKNTEKVLAKFETINDAYRYLGKDINGNISGVCKGNFNSIYGYKWKYI